jgi:hypothetical protein
MHKLIAAALMAAALPAFGQSDYPNKPLTMIVPFPPGGVADITARPVAEALGRYLKQPVVVENKAGAGGGVGMAFVAKTKSDGYTVLMALSSISIIPEADKILGRTPMYQLNQLVPIARFTADPTVLAVRADSPWKNAKDLLDSLRFLGQLRHHARAHGNVHRFGRNQDAARALLRSGPRRGGAARRQRRCALDRALVDHGPPQGRQGPRARELGGLTPSRFARGAHTEGAGL